MKPIVAFPFRHHGSLVSQDAKQMLLDAGFELVCNDTGRKLDRDEQKALIQDAFAVIISIKAPYRFSSNPIVLNSAIRMGMRFSF